MTGRYRPVLIDYGNKIALFLENIEALADEEEDFKNPCPYTGGTCTLKIGGRYVVYIGYRY